jgi:hypothetical protein
LDQYPANPLAIIMHLFEYAFLNGTPKVKNKKGSQNFK